MAAAMAEISKLRNYTTCSLDIRVFLSFSYTSHCEICRLDINDDKKNPPQAKPKAEYFLYM